jgi:FixJ family two-component response regulator
MSLIPKKGTVYVVDDDEAVRDSLQWLLEGKDYRVKCFDAAESFLSRFDPREVACLIADIRMDGMSGLELQDRLMERKSPLPIVFITGHGDVPMAVTAMKAGASDFVQKPFRDQDLIDRINRALTLDLQRRKTRAGQDEIRARLALLTPREREVMERVARGQANKVIAMDLGVSQRTIELHRARVMKKLKMRSVAELVHALDRIGGVAPVGTAADPGGAVSI